MYINDVIYNKITCFLYFLQMIYVLINSYNINLSLLLVTHDDIAKKLVSVELITEATIQ
jgi:hypothetical protein